MFQGLLVKKECLERIDYLDEKIISYQEWDTSIRLAEHYLFGFIEDPLFIYHCHTGETISKDLRRDADGWRQIVEKHRDNIVSHAGQDALAQHYLTLSRKYSSIGNIELEHKFQSMALENFSRVYQWKNYILGIIKSNSLIQRFCRRLLSLARKIRAN